MDICNLWFDSICFGIGKGIASLIKGMIKGAIDGYQHPEKYPNYLSKEEQKTSKFQKRTCTSERCLKLKDGRLPIPQEMTILFC